MPNIIERNRAVQQVLDLLDRYDLTPQDLIKIGGEDLRPGSKLRSRARRVEKCWEMMARLGVKHTDISADETAPLPRPRPEKRARRRRGEREIPQGIEIARDLPLSSADKTTNGINHLANPIFLGGPETENREIANPVNSIDRRLARLRAPKPKSSRPRGRPKKDVRAAA
jgi:hypothetical protein